MTYQRLLNVSIPQMTRETFHQDARSIKIEASPASVWSVIKQIGGEHGWYHADWLWVLRGALDHLVGGIGLRRNRRERKGLAQGDTVDFWRVVRVVPGEHLLLSAEMKLPGRATLEFQISDAGTGMCELRQTARFWSNGILGALYWRLLRPLHSYIFGGMIKKIRKIALRQAAASYQSEPHA